MTPCLQTRCTAVETLHHAVLDISDAQQVLPCLTDTVQLLVNLMDDPNFKVGSRGRGTQQGQQQLA